MIYFETGTDHSQISSPETQGVSDRRRFRCAYTTQADATSGRRFLFAGPRLDEGGSHGGFELASSGR